MGLRIPMAKRAPVKIMLRKSSWDPSIDDVLLSEQSTLNLLYIQTVADLERGWIVTSAETKQQLALMQARGSKRQYMEVARTLKFYGFMMFRACVSDHPEPHTRVTVGIGKSSLNMRISSSNREIQEDGGQRLAQLGQSQEFCQPFSN